MLDTKSRRLRFTWMDRRPEGRKRLRWLLLLLILTAAAWPISRQFIRPAGRQPLPVPVEVQSAALLAAGIASAENGRWLEAVERLDAARRAGADAPELHRALGRCYGELGWVTDTITEYEEAIRQDPSFFNTYISLATAYRSLGRRSEALRTLRNAEQLLRSTAQREAAARYARPVAPQLEELAEAYARLGEHNRALEWAGQAQITDPLRARGYLLAGKSYLVIQQADRAIPLLQRACALAPSDPDARYTLALALRARPSRPHDEAALKHLTAAVSLHPEHAPALYQLGLLLSERKQWNDALRAFESAYALRFEPGALLWRAGRACEASGDRMRAAFFLGQYYEYIGELATSLRYLRTYCSDPKNRAVGYALMARTLTKMRRPQEALAALQKAIALAPQSAQLRRQQAEVYGKMQQVSKQIAALQEAIRLDPQNAHQDYHKLGRIAAEAGQHDESERYQEKSIELRPDNGLYHYLLGETYLMRAEREDRLNRAIRHLEEAQRLLPDSAFAHDFLSTAYMKAERWEDAAASLRRSIDLTPQNEILYYRLGQVYQRLDRPVDAKRAQTYYQRLRQQTMQKDLMRRRVKARPNDPKIRVAMGDLLLRSRDYLNARREYEKALDLQPDNTVAHERLVTVYGELSQPEGQWRHLQKARALARRAGSLG